MRTRATITLAATLLLAVTACSSSDDNPKTAPATKAAPSTSPTPAAAAELEQAVRAYTAAYFKGDAETGYRTLSKRCQENTVRELYDATVKQAAKDYGPDHPATDVRADVSGDLARVSYKVRGLPKFDQAQQPWTREGGAWKYDAC
ncbi:hypothetical protein ACFW08_20195 [Streptomyces sp. NPDC058960]|uniref:hypothetical protein n=1 Tax=Streptomyces sp. NPDC058960 TaxID=3346679 RepID=UPI0036CC63D9